MRTLFPLHIWIHSFLPVLLHFRGAPSYPRSTLPLRTIFFFSLIHVVHMSAISMDSLPVSPRHKAMPHTLTTVPFLPTYSYCYSLHLVRMWPPFLFLLPTLSFFYFLFFFFQRPMYAYQSQCANQKLFGASKTFGVISTLKYKEHM